MKPILKFFALSLIAVTFCTHATTDNRRKMPVAFKQSYIGLDAGWMDVPFTNNDLESGLTASNIELPHAGIRIFIGHYFNPHFAIQASLMRPFNWAHFEGVTGTTQRQSVWFSLFGITFRPTIFLANRVSLYGNLGVGFISRHGFEIGNIYAVKNDFITSLLTGGGLAYTFDKHWHYDVGVSYTPENRRKKQPHIVYVYTGFYYVLSPSNEENDYSEKKHYIFPLNFFQAGFFTNALFYEDANQYVTEGYLPIFWDGKVKNSNGVYLMYERNFFHTDRTFSLEWGASVARYQTNSLRQTYYTFSLFPAFKVWIVRSKFVDFYFTYSVAGPTYITRHYLDSLDTGTNFIFQDFLGFGLFLGQKKDVNVNVKIGHYSNGNLFPMNAGIEVPLTIGLGFTFD